MKRFIFKLDIGLISLTWPSSSLRLVLPFKRLVKRCCLQMTHGTKDMQELVNNFAKVELSSA